MTWTWNPRDPESRRLCSVVVPRSYLLGVMRGEARVFMYFRHDLPRDTEIAHIYADPNRDAVVAIVWSSEFEMIEDGAIPPAFSEWYQALRTREKSRV